MADNTIAIISAVTALFAVILGPLVTLLAARMQSRVAVLSANRQAWINALRDLVSEYVSISGLIHAGEWSSRTEIEFDKQMERLMFINAKISLMLNPEEEDHKDLRKLLDDLLLTMGGRAAASEKKDPKKARALSIKLVPLSQSILKREWVRVKQVK